MTTIPVVSSSTIVGFLKIALGLPLLERSEGENAVPLPSAEVRNLDTGAFIAWVLVGLELCQRPQDDKPWTLQADAAVAAAKAAAFGLAMVRHSHNKTHAAKAANKSRRVLRECLKRAGLEPWPKTPPLHVEPWLMALARAWQDRNA